MSQLALPFGPHVATPHSSAEPRIIVGNANADAIAALRRAGTWPYGAAVLTGPPRAGKSLLARWFGGDGTGRAWGEAIDDAHLWPEDELFHRWNRAQESGTPLLIIDGSVAAWRIALPDLASRLGSALHLAIGTPDDAMLGELLAAHAEARGFALDDAALAYLVPRCERSHMGAERLIVTIDRLSLERLQPPNRSIWRDALCESGIYPDVEMDAEIESGAEEQPRLL